MSAPDDYRKLAKQLLSKIAHTKAPRQNKVFDLVVIFFKGKTKMEDIHVISSIQNSPFKVQNPEFQILHTFLFQCVALFFSDPDAKSARRKKKTEL